MKTTQDVKKYISDLITENKSINIHTKRLLNIELNEWIPHYSNDEITYWNDNFVKFSYLNSSFKRKKLHSFVVVQILSEDFIMKCYGAFDLPDIFSSNKYSLNLFFKAYSESLKTSELNRFSQANLNYIYFPSVMSNFDYSLQEIYSFLESIPQGSTGDFHVNIFLDKLIEYICEYCKLSPRLVERHQNKLSFKYLSRNSKFTEKEKIRLTPLFLKHKNGMSTRDLILFLPEEYLNENPAKFMKLLVE